MVRPLYDKIQTDLKKFEGAGESEGSNIIDALGCDLAKQLSQFVSARKEMIDLYPLQSHRLYVSHLYSIIRDDM